MPGVNGSSPPRSVRMRERLRIAVHGVVQGVGFRPGVYRLAGALRVEGWVRNSPQGVLIEVEGQRDQLEQFRQRLVTDAPPRAVIQGIETSWLDSIALRGFEILESDSAGPTATLVMPDVATCGDCRRELFDPGDRRYRYPFTNCTNCGPRFSLIESLPYDRAATSMKRFRMCAACQREYDDPQDRRFHAQPNACPDCGPQLALWDAKGEAVAIRDDALRTAAAAILAGRIVAVKGVGGFHLMVAAGDQAAVERLRDRKHREEKPFALMYPGLEEVARDCAVSADEARLLTSPESPIVILRRRDAAIGVAPAVAPGNPSLGILLPSTPLHWLLMSAIGVPAVATSGNLSDEPICTDEREAVHRLGGVADLFLVHDRPIVRHVDDSIVRIVLGRELVVRRARGYAPLPIPLRHPSPPLLAVGGHLKNSVAVASGRNVFVSQHIGDLESAQASAAFEKVIDDLESLYAISPSGVVADLHPDYRSTRYARTLGLPVSQVQHHYAHVAACMAENDLEGPALGVSWDGTGYGLDGTIWGGEFLSVDDQSFSRAACLRPFRLPGGERAVREPRRSALGLLFALGRAAAAGETLPTGGFALADRPVIFEALARELNSPITTSAGRLCDGVASLIGLRHLTSFEGQAAMELEYAVDARVDDAYPFAVTNETARFAMGSWQAPPLVVDWGPLVDAILHDLRVNERTGTIAARFHNTLADIVVAVAERHQLPRIVLTGGCFQNCYLVERTVSRLRAAGFRPYWHQRIPANDGGISLGQIAACVRALPAAVVRTVAPHPDRSTVLAN
jgi:hydrogenase maturation protein HypF